MRKLKLEFIFFILLLHFSLPTISTHADTEEKTFNSSINLGGIDIPYKCTAGFIPINNDAGQHEAAIFYFAYHKEQSATSTPRPVTFCFNGGPGASSVWMHMGGFGPLKVNIPDVEYPKPPFSNAVNIHSILDLTDLVFVDPISTGFSRAATGIEAKNFYNVKEDTRTLAQFVRLYITRNKLWNAPKFLMGESYGGYRITELASYLHDNDYIYLNGLIYISPALNFQTIQDPSDGNDLPYSLALPSYTAAAGYHNNLPHSEEALRKCEAFSLGPYTVALMKGDDLTPQEKDSIAEELGQWTGLKKDYLLRAQLRILPGAFTYELLKPKSQTIGRFDSRYLSPTEYDKKPIIGSIDPSAEAYLGAFSSGIQMYLSSMDWQTSETYEVLTNTNPWNFSPNSNQYPSVGDSLRSLMVKNPHLRVFVASGYYDLATPYMATHYVFTHLGLNPDLFNHIRHQRYQAGHMIYLDSKALPLLKEDLKKYFMDR